MENSVVQSQCSNRKQQKFLSELKIQTIENLPDLGVYSVLLSSQELEQTDDDEQAEEEDTEMSFFSLN